MKIKVTTRGLDTIHKAFEQVFAKLHAEVEKEVVISALRIERRAKFLCPVDTGWLMSSISATKAFATKRIIHIEIVATADYATEVHETHPTQGKFIEIPAQAEEAKLRRRLFRMIEKKSPEFSALVNNPKKH